MPIPAKASKPADSLGTRTCILFGDPGIGKSTLCADIPDSIILATEKGLNQLTSLKWEYADGSYVIKSWDDLVMATKEVVGAKRFRTIVIDNMTGLCWLAERHILAKYGEEWKADGVLGYGKGAGLIGNLLRLYIVSLTNVNTGLWIIGHAATETTETRTGNVDRIIPSVPGDNKKKDLLNILVGLMDMVLFATSTLVEVEGGKKVPHRVLRTQPAVDYVAKCRGEKGAPPMLDPVPLSWAKLEQAYAMTQPVQTTRELKVAAS